MCDLALMNYATISLYHVVLDHTIQNRLQYISYLDLQRIL